MLKAKRKVVITSLVAVIGLLVGALSVSLTWFAKMNSISDLEIGGSVLSQYFDSGDGTQANPFVITRPKHWENLVWLHNNVSNFYQAITDDQVDPSQQNDQGYYFQVGKLNETLNDGIYYVYDYGNDGLLNPNNSQMNSRILNLQGLGSLIPIGCDTKPFLGVINGHGISVSGFDVVGFEDTNYNLQHESNEAGFNDVGIFGYIGNDSAVNDIYFNNFTIHLANADATRSNTTTLHGNNFHASTENGAPDTVYAGYIAGHMHYSSSVNNVYVNNCSFDGGTPSTSGFGFFGIVEQQNGGTKPTPLQDITEIKQAGDGNNFGGSVDMLGVFERLQHIYDEATTTNQYVNNEIVVENTVTGSVESLPQSYATSTPWATQSQVGSNNTPIAYKYASTESGGEFTFPDDNDGVGSSTVNSNGTYYYQCLYGESSHYTKTVTKYTYIDDWYDCFFIINGDNYLNHRYYATVQNTTDETHAAGWYFDNSHHLCTKVFDTVYYLNQTNGSLVMSTTGNTTWTQTEDDEIYTVINSVDYYLDFEDTWCLSPYADRYTINDGNSNYMKVANNIIQITQTESEALEVFITNVNGNTTKIGFNRNNTIYYLGANNENLVISTSPTDWNVENSHYYVTVQGIKFYLVFENGTWSLKPESAVRLSNNGNNYLNTTDNSTLSNLTNNNTVYWQFTSDVGDTQIYYIYNGQKCYLCCDGNLFIGASGTTWHRNGNGIYCTIANHDYYLIYNNGWRVTDLEFYTINDNNGNFLVANGTNNFSNGDSASATHFYFSDLTGTDPAGTINYVYHNTVYYLNLSVTDSVGSLQSSTSSNSTDWSNDGTSIYKQIDSIIYYLEYNGLWSIRTYANAYQITDGTNYLRVDNTAISNATNANNASLFVFSNTVDPSGTIKILGTNNYLRNNNGTLQVSTTITSWSNNGTLLYNGDYYLCYFSGWKLLNVAYGYYISRSGYYLNLNGTSLSTTTTASTLWYGNPFSGSSGTIKAVGTGTTYYLYANTGSGATISASTSSISWSVNNNRLYFTNSEGWIISRTYCYTIYLNSTSFDLNRAQSSSPSTSESQLTFTRKDFSSDGVHLTNNILNSIATYTEVVMPTITVTNYSATKNGTTTYNSTKDYSQSFSQTSLQNCQKTLNNVTQKGGNPTYFPLRVDLDEDGNYPNGYEASDKNTGYIISGANLGSTSNVMQQQYGDIRISGYPISNVTSSYSTTTKKILDTVYTVDGNNAIRALNETERNDSNYKTAKEALEISLGGDPEHPNSMYDNKAVFGLHFMEATISKNNIVRAKHAKILGKNYYNYPLPQDSIDFNVYQRGQISFRNSLAFR